MVEIAFCDHRGPITKRMRRKMRMRSFGSSFRKKFIIITVLNVRANSGYLEIFLEALFRVRIGPLQMGPFKDDLLIGWTMDIRPDPFSKSFDSLKGLFSNK